MINYLINKLKKDKLQSIAFKFEITNKNLYMQNFIEKIGIKLKKKNDNYLINTNKILNNEKNYITRV